MKNNHQVVLKEITDELELLMVSGGKGSGDWGTGAQGVWAAGVEGVTGKSCSYPGGFFGPSNPTPTGSGLCTGGFGHPPAGVTLPWCMMGNKDRPGCN
ncbi:hypothetical protein [Hafnia paralvei]|uniref:hypothetical protein n=1 Tax=Hafnia paralvei TaxID=546367 RepID=UPI001034D576|nr:hypothetical protein [Hafnia paralvei]TBL63631.1 hypothetical protein EYY97_06005 [Hafnia paralvei]